MSSIVFFWLKICFLSNHRCSPVLCWRRGVCWVFEWHQHFRAKQELQLPPQLPPYHRLQDPKWLQPQDLQQSGVCSAARPVGQSRLWGSLWAHKDVHYSHEFCEGIIFVYGVHSDMFNSFWGFLITFLYFEQKFDLVPLLLRVGELNITDRMWPAPPAG